MDSPQKKQLKRDTDREALIRREEGARTIADFKGVLQEWDRLDTNREKRESNHEIPRESAEMLHWSGGEDGEMRYYLDVVIPAPFDGHAFWHQHLSGDFLDIILDCPHEVQDQTANRGVCEYVGELKAEQKEVLYYRAIRLYSPQQVAAIRGQTDRNIRKVYDTLIKRLRKKMNDRLTPRYVESLSLTLEQKQFLEWYDPTIIERKKARDKEKEKERKKEKAALDGGEKK